MFRGINAISMDVKGRLAVPARYREALSADGQSELVLTIDIEETCLLLYPMAQWQQIEKKIQALPSFNPAARRIQRLLIGHATDVEMDGAGRFLVPPLLREYARLDRKVVMIGQGNKFEVWDEDLWQQKREAWLEKESGQQNLLPEEMQHISL